MLSTLCFVVVNMLLFCMLINIMSNKGTIELDFLLCLLFTFLGNLLFVNINLVFSLINVLLGLKLVKID